MKLGVIGTGNMASAIVEGILKKQFMACNDIYCYNIYAEEATAFASRFNINKCATYKMVVEETDYILLAVKPNVIPEVITAIKSYLTNNKTLISIAAGVNIKAIEALINQECPIIRVMPNINAIVQEGAAGICFNQQVKEKQEQFVFDLFNSLGKTYRIAEKDFPTYAAIAGCSPAFTYLFIDALARAAVRNGLKKEQAVDITAQAVLGSAKMLLEGTDSPFNLIDKVCSPGGTTIEGIYTLEDEAFMGTIMNAVQASIDKDYELQKKE